jgi:hypothetical protein
MTAPVTADELFGVEEPPIKVVISQRDFRQWMRDRETFLSPEMYGAVGNGLADDQTALEEWLADLAAGGVGQLTRGKSYRFTAPLSQVITGNVRIVGHGNAFLFDPAARADIAFRIFLDDAALTFSMENLDWDFQDMARYGIWIDNNSSSMANAGWAKFSRVKGKNVVADSTSTNGMVFLVRGGFHRAEFDRCEAMGATMLEGASSVGNNAVRGISASLYSAVNSYVRHLLVNGGVVSNILSSPVIANDQDGIGFNGNPDMDTIVEVVGTEFENCQTRSVKSQAARTVIRNTTSRRDAATLGAGADGASYLSVEYDAQYGNATYEGISCIYDDASPKYIFNASLPATGLAGISSVKSCRVSWTGSTNALQNICSTFPQGTDSEMTLFDVDGVTVDAECAALVVRATNDDGPNPVSVGRCVVAGCTLGLVSILASLKRTAAATSNVYVIENQNTGSACPLVVDNQSGLVAAAYVSGSRNTGFVAPAVGDGLAGPGGSRQELVRARAYGPAAGGNAIGGYSPQTQVVADDATASFSVRGAWDSLGMALVTTTFSRNAMAMVALDTANIATVHAGSLVDVGSTSNPDTDGSINIWLDTTAGTLQIKNRLGSSRTISVHFFG